MNITHSQHVPLVDMAHHCFVDYSMDKGKHLLLKSIPSDDKEMLTNTSMLKPSQFYINFVQHVYTYKEKSNICPFQNKRLVTNLENR